MKKLKIKGITGTPMFFTRLRGRLDGKRGAVTLDEDGWHGPYLDERGACCTAFIHSIYTGLEADSAPLYEESARLVVEHQDILDKLAQPREVPIGPTASVQTRSAGQLAAAQGGLDARRLEIELRLASIDETLTHSVNDTAWKHRQATSLTGKRIHAYLHGAALATGKTQAHTQVDAPQYTFIEEEFRARHSTGDRLRQSVLENALKEGTRQ